MLNIVLLISSFFLIRCICITVNDMPLCSSCRWFMPSIMGTQYGLCKLYKYKSKKNEVIYEFAEFCRNDENMCGKEGLLYDKKSSNKFNLKTEDDEYIDEIFDKYYELNNRGCGEVNENSELEEIEEEFAYLFLKIKNVLEKYKLN